MVVGLKELIILNDSLRYSLVPLERVSYFSVLMSYIFDLICEYKKAMTLFGNVKASLVVTEMERDCILSHGMGLFLKERTMETADKYSCHVCGICGLFAQRLKKQNQKHYATHNDVYYCPGCRNTTDIHKTSIPYAFKLLVQEMMSMNIAPRMKFADDA